MKRIIYKTITLFLCTMLILTLLPISAVYADDSFTGTTVDGFSYSATPANGETPAFATITGYSGTAVALTIPATITASDNNNYPVRTVTTGSKFAYGIYCPFSSTATSVVISEGIEEIDNGIFYNCTTLASATLPSTLKTIGHHVFTGTRLTSINLPASVTSIGEYAFYNSTLAGLNLPANITTIGAVSFAGTKIENLIIPASVSSIGDSAFNGCTSLSQITFASGSSLAGISSSVFAYAPITAIELPDSITSINTAAFYHCTKLESISLPDSLTSLNNPWSGEYGVFQECTSLGAITIPFGVTQIGFNSFAGCGNLSSVTFESDNTMTEIMGYAFMNCQKLNAVNLPDSLTVIGSAAFLNTGLTHIEIPAGVMTLPPEAFRWCSKLQAVSFSQNSSLETISNAAFQHCISLTSLQLPETVKCIKPDAFGYTTALTFVVIPAGVSEIGSNAFNGNYADGTTSNSALSAAYFFEAPPTTFGDNVFANTTTNFSVYYHISREASWASFNAYNKAPFVKLTLKLYDQTETTALAPLDGAAHITVPTATTRIGFEFKGWYTDESRTTPFDAQSTTVNADFTLYAKWDAAQTINPVITSISPASGPAAGGTSVTLTGTGFTGVTAVKFGQTDALTFTPVSASEISAASPAGMAGSTVGVTVTTPYGTSTPAAYTYSIGAVPEGSIHVIVSGNITGGWLLKVWSSSMGSGAVAAISAGLDEYTLSGLVPATDYTVRIVDDNGLSLDKEDGITVIKEQTTDVSLTPVSAAKLQIYIKDNSGNALSGIRVVVNDAVTGAFIGSAYSEHDGSIPDISYLSGKSVTIQALANTNPYYNRIITGQNLSAGDNTLDIAMQPLPGAALIGSVLDSNSNAVVGGIVTAMQTIDGRRWTFTAVTGTNGTYSLPLLEGDAVVDAAAPGSNTQRSVKGVSVTGITSSGKTQNFLLPRISQQGAVSVRLFTGSNGQNYIELPVDWRVACHYQMKATVQNDTRTYSAGIEQYPIIVYGVPGDKVTVFGDGREIGLSSQSVEVTLDENCNAVASIYLDKHATVSGNVKNDSGTAVSGFAGVLYSVENGKRTWVSSFYSETSSFEVSAPDSGNYVVEIHYNGNIGVSDVFPVSGTGTVNAGTVTVGSKITEGEVTLQPDNATVGGYVNVRASYHNLFHSTTTLDGAHFLMEIPGGSELVAGSVHLTNEQGTAEQFTVDTGTPGILDAGVAVTDQNILAAELTYQLKLDPDYTAAAVSVTGKLRFPSSANASYLGFDMAQVDGLRLLVPGELNTLSTTVSGYGPANSKVQIYDKEVLLGEATATVEGFFTLPVTLPDTGNNRSHTLWARAAVAENTVLSESKSIKYNAYATLLTKMTMEQTDGRAVSINPSEGVATFPYLLVPGMPMTFTLEFDKPDNVYDVMVITGDGNRTRATAATKDGKKVYQAEYVPGYVLGPVSVIYQTRSSKADWYEYQILPGDVEDKARVETNLPWFMKNYEVMEHSLSSDQKTGTFKLKLPELDNAELEVEFSTENVSFDLSASERAEAKATGVPAFRIARTSSDSSTESTQMLSMLLPEDETAYDAAMVGDPDGIGLVLKAKSAVKEGLTLAEKIIKGYEVYDTLKGAYGLGQKGADAMAGEDNWGKLNLAEQQLTENANSLSSQRFEYFKKRIEDQRTELAKQEISSSATDVGLTLGMLAPHISIPLSIVIAPLWEANDLQNEMNCENIYNDLNSDIDTDFIKNAYKKARDCDKIVEELGHKPIKIYDTWDGETHIDPSGYLYEGLEENRLAGVTATLLYLDEGQWVMWDYIKHGTEANPQLTDESGRYEWNVPAGQYKVVYTKNGYETAESEVMTIPPPRTDVNIGMQSQSAPVVSKVTAAAGGTAIEVAFSQYMLSSGLLTGTAITVTDQGGQPVTGSIQAVTAGSAPGGTSLALAAHFVPDTQLSTGTVYSVTVDHSVKNYAGREMSSDSGVSVTVPATAPQPAITAVSPACGLEAGGTKVCITGNNFLNATAVKFGSAAAAEFSVRSDGQIMAIAPAGSGTAAVAVTTAGGESGSVGFTYYSAAAQTIPGVTSVSPSSGPSEGGNTIAISGTGFTGVNSVYFGSTEATGVNVVSDTQITAKVPVGVGVKNISVSKPTAASNARETVAYTYLAAAEQPVGESGALMQTANGGGTLLIPSGAFTSQQKVTLSEKPESDFTVPSGYVMVGGPIMVLFESMLPSLPVTLSVSCDLSEMPSGYTTAIYKNGSAGALSTAMNGLNATADITESGLYAVLAKAPASGTGTGENTVTGGNSSSGGTTAGTEAISSTGTGIQLSGTDSKVVVTVEATLSASGAAIAEISPDLLDAAFLRSKADNTGIKKVVVNIPEVEGAKSYEPVLPVSFFVEVNRSKAIEIKTPIGSVTIQGNMLTERETKGVKKVSISITSIDRNTLSAEIQLLIGNKPVIGLQMKLDGKEASWKNPNAPVRISVPYVPTAAELASPEHIVIWYIDGSGKAVCIPDGHYDAASGTVTFTTTHFSSYAIGYNKASFRDVADKAWYAKAVGFIAARNITGGTGNGNYSPDSRLTRGEFIVMLLKACDIELDTSPKNNFSDAGNTWYTGYLAAAKSLDISGGIGDNRFAPNAQITRQEMFTLLYKALKAVGKLPSDTTGKSLVAFSDKDRIAVWARDAMSAMVKSGIVSGSSGKLSPTDTATRAQMAQVLYNLLAK
jgi:uncharacterized repeat protein (TIGR02543 family)